MGGVAALVPAEGSPPRPPPSSRRSPQSRARWAGAHPHSASVPQAVPLSCASAPLSPGLDQGHLLREDLVLTNHVCSGRAP